MDSAELSSLRQENDANRELLRLDRDLFDEYDALVTESDSQPTAHGKPIRDGAGAVPRAPEEARELAD